jgi:hypothetical protein
MESKGKLIAIVPGLWQGLIKCKLMMVSHDMLVAMQTWKNNNLLTWRDYSRYFYNEFEYGVKI